MSSDEARFGGRAPVTFRNGVGQVEAVALIFVLTMQMHPRVQPHAPLTRFPILVDQVQVFGPLIFLVFRCTLWAFWLSALLLYVGFGLYSGLGPILQLKST